MKIVSYSKSALQTLRRMPANTATNIRNKVDQYARDPTSLANNVKRLTGRTGWRLRVGDWRVIFDDDGVVLAILAIGPRGGIYD